MKHIKNYSTKIKIQYPRKQPYVDLFKNSIEFFIQIFSLLFLKKFNIQSLQMTSKIFTHLKSEFMLIIMILHNCEKLHFDD